MDKNFLKEEVTIAKAEFKKWYEGVMDSLSFDNDKLLPGPDGEIDGKYVVLDDSAYKQRLAGFHDVCERLGKLEAYDIPRKPVGFHQ